MSVRDKVSEMARGPWALPVSVLLGFLEGSFVLVAMEPLFIPLMAARARRAWIIAASLLLGNVLAGLFMYALGAFLADPEVLLGLAGEDAMATFRDISERLRQDGFLGLFAIGITPFPFQLGTAAAGAVGYPIVFFVLAITLSRAIRYFGLAIIVTMIGARARQWLEDHEIEIFIAGALIFVVFALIAFLT